jgi:hypothetical protein
MKKIKITMGDIKEAWYIMECPCDFKEFVQSYLEDDEYEVTNDFTVTIYNDNDCGMY